MTVESSEGNFSTEVYRNIIDSIVAQIRVLCNEITNDPSLSVSIIESNSILLNAKKTLLSLATFSSVVPYTIESFRDLIAEQNIIDANVYIKKRSEASLKILYVLTLLLSDFTETNWRAKERSEFTSLSSRSTEDSDKEYPHTVAADPIDEKLASSTLQVLIKIKSYKKARSLLRQLEGGVGYFELSSSNQIIADIDFNVDALARFLSSASSTGYSKTTEIATLNNVDLGNFEFLGYLEFLAFLNLSINNFDKEFQALIYFSEHFKSHSLQLIHASFFADATLEYCICYPKEFMENINKTSTNKLGDIYFEKIYAKSKLSTESEKQFYMKNLALSFIAQPKQFEVFFDPENKKLKNNKKQKVLFSVTKNLYDGIDKLPTLQFLLLIFNVASILIQYEPNHIIVKYAKKHIEATHDLISPDNTNSLIADTDLAALDKIRIEFYALALLIDPDTIKPIVINIIANADTSMQFYYIIAHSLRNLIRMPNHNEFTYKLIGTIAITLRDSCGNLAKIVHETVGDYDNLLSDNSSSSSSWRYAASRNSDTKTVLSSKFSQSTLANSEGNRSSTVREVHTVNPVTEPSKKKDKTRNVVSFLTNFRDKKNKHSNGNGNGNNSNVTSNISSTTSNGYNGNNMITSTSSNTPSHNETSHTYFGKSLSKSSSQSFSNSHSTAHNSSYSAMEKPISVLNAEYLKRMENESFLSREILKLIFQIFRSYPLFFFKLPAIYNYNSSDDTPKEIGQTKKVLFSLKRILDPLLISFGDNDLKLVDRARKLTKKFLEFDENGLLESYTAFFSSCHLQIGFVEISLTYYLHEKKFSEFFGFVTLVWTKRIEILKRINIEDLLSNIGEEGYLMVQKCLEESEKLLFISLCQPGTDCYRLIKENARLFTLELDTENSPFYSSLKKTMNYNVFKQICDTNYFVSGQAALQKKLHKVLLTNFETYSDGMVQSLEIIFQRWKEMFSNRHKNLIEHRNYARFLATAFGFDDSELKRSLEDDDDLEANQKYSDVRESRLSLFISRKCDDLCSEDVSELENAKDLFINELHPNLHKSILRKISEELDKTLHKKKLIDTQKKSVAVSIDDELDTDLYLTKKEFIGLDSYLTILAGFLNNNEHDISYYNSAELRMIALKLINLLKKTNLTDLNYVRITIKACKFISKMAENSEVLGLKAYAVKWKNQILLVAAAWLDTICFGYKSEKNLFEVKEDMKVFTFFELALECLKTLSSLFKQTLIYPLGAQYRAEVKIDRSVTLVNIFNLFSRVLECCMRKETESVTLSPIQRKIQLIKEETIVAFSNMLEHNYDIALQYTMPLSFHSDVHVKEAFLTVFSNIIETLQTSSFKNSEKFKKECLKKFALLIGNNSDIVISLAKATALQDYDVFSYNMLEILAAVDKEVPILTEMFNYEVKNSFKTIDVLRRNSNIARMLSLYAKKHANDYLQDILNPIFEKLIKKKDFFEVEKLSQDNDLIVEENVGKFFTYLTSIVNNIADSVDKVPNELKVICSRLRASVLEKTEDNESALTVISCFIFLRFVCPAIVNPETVETDNKEMKRSFIQLAKVFQNLANDSISMIRWPNLSDKKSELTILKDKLFRFLDNISRDFTLQAPVKEATFTIAEENFAAINSILIQRNEEFVLNIRKFEDNFEENLKDLNELETIFIDIGHQHLLFKPKIPEAIRANRDKNPLTYDLFMRYKDFNDVALIESPFLQQSYSRNGTILLTFSVKYFQGLESYDVDLLVYRTLQACHRQRTEAFKTLIDCSFFKPQFTDRFIEFFNRIIMYMPDFWKECISMTYYNVNSHFLVILKRIFKNQFKGLAMRSTSCPVNFLSPFDKLEVLKASGVPTWSTEIIKDVHYTIDCFIYSAEQKKYVPLVIKVGSYYCYWSSLFYKVDGPSSMSFESKNIRIVHTSKVTDWFHAKPDPIDNLVGEKERENSFQVVVKGFGTLNLMSSKGINVLSTVYLAKLHFQLYNSQKYVPFYYKKEYFIGESFLGSYLASILFNMISNSEEVRNIAFSSLIMIINYYGLKLNRNLIAEGTSFPKNFLPFVSEINKSLAENHPELTYDFLTTINENFATSENYYGTLMLFSPWILQIHEQYNLKWGIQGSDKILQFVQMHFSRLHQFDEQVLLAFDIYVWKYIVIDVHLCSIAVSVALNEATFYEAVGRDWTKLKVVMTYYPTIEVCEYLLRDASDALNANVIRDGDEDIWLKMSWVRGRVLLKCLESVTFDSIYMTETFLPEFAAIVVVAINVGDHDVKDNMRNLFFNTFNCILSSKIVTEESKKFLSQILDEFSLPSAKGIFGLNGNSTQISGVHLKQDSQFQFSVNLEKLILAIMQFMDLQEEHLRIAWKNRWNQVLISPAMKQHCPFRERALLCAGAICKLGVTDTIVTEIFKKHIEWYYNDSSLNNGFLVTMFLTLGSISEGLANISLYSGLLFRSAFYWSTTRCSPLFQSATKMLVSTVIGLTKNGILNEERDLLQVLNFDEKEVKSLLKVDLAEGAVHVKTNLVLDSMLIHFAMRCLIVPSSRKYGINMLVLFYRVRILNEYYKFMSAKKAGTIASEQPFLSTPIAYMIPLFVLQENEKDYHYSTILKETNINTGVSKTYVDFDIPQVILDFFSTDTDEAYLIMYQMSVLYNKMKSDEMSLAFIHLLAALTTEAPDMGFFGYVLLKNQLLELLKGSNSLNLIRVLSKIFEKTHLHPDYRSPEKHLSKVDNLLSKYNLAVISDISLNNEKESAAMLNTKICPALIQIVEDKSLSVTRVD